VEQGVQGGVCRQTDGWYEHWREVLSSCEQLCKAYQATYQPKQHAAVPTATHLRMLPRLATAGSAAGRSGLKACLKAAGGAVHNQECGIRLWKASRRVVRRGRRFGSMLVAF